MVFDKAKAACVPLPTHTRRPSWRDWMRRCFLAGLVRARAPPPHTPSPPPPRYRVERPALFALNNRVACVFCSLHFCTPPFPHTHAHTHAHTQCVRAHFCLAHSSYHTREHKKAMRASTTGRPARLLATPAAAAATHPLLARPAASTHPTSLVSCSGRVGVCHLHCLRVVGELREKRERGRGGRRCRNWRPAAPHLTSPSPPPLQPRPPPPPPPPPPSPRPPPPPL